MFQLTPSQRATGSSAVPISLALFQLTPSQRATNLAGISNIVIKVSTHALTEGDNRFYPTAFNSNVSTHALTEGDCLRLDFATYLVHVSTHALTEGDAVCKCFGQLVNSFNSRPHRGRLLILPGKSSWLMFQLTPSQRATVPQR